MFENGGQEGREDNNLNVPCSLTSFLIRSYNRQGIFQRSHRGREHPGGTKSRSLDERGAMER